MQIIPGSHRLGLLSERGHTISAEHEAQYAKDEDSIFLEAKVGEVFVLHNWLLHRSRVNTIEHPRRHSASVIWTQLPGLHGTARASLWSSGRGH